MPKRATTASLQQGFHDTRASDARARWSVLTLKYMRPGVTLAEAAGVARPIRPAPKPAQRTALDALD